jgi:hypothetical protein
LKGKIDKIFFNKNPTLNARIEKKNQNKKNPSKRANHHYFFKDE